MENSNRVNRKPITQIASCPRLWRTVFYSLCAFILYLATTPLDYPVPASDYDKANHFLAFLVLGFIIGLAHRSWGKGIQAAFLLAYGMLIEVWQYFLPFREFSLMDWLADGLGIAAGLILVHIFWRQVRKSSPV